MITETSTAAGFRDALGATLREQGADQPLRR